MDRSPATSSMTESQRFEAFFEHASVGILVANEKGVIQILNKQLLQQFDYHSKEELIGQKVEVLIPSRYTPGHARLREGYNDHPVPRSMGVGRDLYAIKKDGTEFPVEVSLSNYRTEQGSFIIAFVIDITRRKAIENEVMQQQQQLELSKQKIEELNVNLEKKVALRTSQLEEAMHQIEAAKDDLEKAFNKEKELGELKSRFVSMASHEFRTPLTTILSSTDLLERYIDAGDSEAARKHTARIKTGVKNLSGILEEFLSLGKIEDGKVVAQPVNFNIQELIGSIGAEIGMIMTSRQQLIIKHSGAEQVFLDPSLLRNIIYNLLSNALKFSGADALVSITSQVEKKGFTLKVEDNGIGVSEADQAHLFERFFRASNAMNIQGTGLGLHIVAKYVELMSGSIDFISQSGEGTSVVLTFPQPLSA